MAKIIVDIKEEYGREQAQYCMSCPHLNRDTFECNVFRVVLEDSRMKFLDWPNGKGYGCIRCLACLLREKDYEELFRDAENA